MTALAVASPLPQFFDLDGSPLSQGKIYFGLPVQNPEISPITAYWDAAATQPAAQPLRTKAGYIVRNGKPATVFIDGAYSITVKNRRGQVVLYEPDSSVLSNDQVILNAINSLKVDLLNGSDNAKGAALIGFSSSAVYPADTVGRALAGSKNLLLDGTVDFTGATPCTAAINTLIANGGDWVIPPGIYLLDGPIIIPDNCILRFITGATIKPSANGLTLFTTKDYAGQKHAYFSQIWNPYIDANGKTGTVCFDMVGLRHSAGIFYPKFIGTAASYDNLIRFTQLCWDAKIVMPFAQGYTNGILIADGSNAVQIIKPGLDALGSAGYGIKFMGGASYPTTTCSVIGGYVQGHSAPGGVGCYDSGAGTAFGTYGTLFDHVYFENNAFADLFFDTSIWGRARNCEHYASIGQNANFGRNNIGVRIEAPIMSSGGRSVGLYNFDTSNQLCYGDMTVDPVSGINLPLGTISGIGALPTEDMGDFPAPGVVIESTGGASTGITYATRLAKWHRIGKRVFLTGQVKWSGWTGPAGSVLIKGAPAALTPSIYAPTGIGSPINLTAWTGADVKCYLNGSGTNILVTQVSTGGILTPLPMAAAGEIVFELSYDL